jgi:hypothetical protein
VSGFAATLWARDQQLPPAQKATLVALASRADERYSCFPSVACIARDTGYTDRTVRTALRALECVGMVITERRKRPDGSFTSSRYVLPVPPHSWSVDKPVNSGANPMEITPGGTEAASGGIGNSFPSHRKQLPLNELTNELTNEPPPSGGVAADALRAGLNPAWFRGATPRQLQNVLALIVATEARGWTAGQIAQAIGDDVGGARNPAAVCAARLRGMGDPPARPPERPPWCGACDERTRMIETDDDRVTRCPTCHPERTTQ